MVKKNFFISNPPVSKLTSPLSGGTRESFEIFYFFNTLASPEREVPERSEVGGVAFKKGEVVSEANRRGFRENKLCLL